MSFDAIDKLLTTLTPDELRQRIADIDRQRAALVVLLRAVSQRQKGRPHDKPAPPREACRA